ncbi:MAG: ABC transporter permease [Actinobacteria bacterium]|nr:ABC transporter permease [Actinomycetota bacterium]
MKWSWVADHGDAIWAATRQHIELTVIAVAIGLAIALPLSVLSYRVRRFYAPLLGATGVLYAIPSLALFSFLIPVTGLTRLTAEIGLVSYTLLILVRNTVTGLEGVPEDARDAARGMGFSPMRQLVRVELPLAAPAILAGVRIATVTTIGLVTVTALIAQGGLGALILNGFNRGFRTPQVVGSVLSVALALAADLVLILAERLATPWRAGR